MRPLLTNLVLAIVWAALAGEMTTANFLVGFVLGYILLSLQHEVVGKSTYYSKLWHLVLFLGYFLFELFIASLRVAMEVLTPQAYSRPGVIAVPLDAKTDFEIMLLSIIISLTPGTLSLDVSQDRRLLFIHAMFVEDPDEVRASIKRGLERRLLELMR
jgi:multicomponent Na+:H+ antiporter subunit E